MAKAKIINQTGVAQKHGQGDEHLSGDESEWFQRIQVHHSNIIDPEDLDPGEVPAEQSLDGAGILFSAKDGVASLLQGSRKDRRLGPFVGRKIGVPRAHGQPVRFPDNGRAHDLDREMEIANHAPDDGELLKVLFTKYGEIGLDDEEELCHHRAHAAEMVRPAGTAKPSGKAGFLDGHRSVRIINRGDFRKENEIRPLGVASCQIRFDRARICAQIFVGSELRRVHEDTDHDATLIPDPAPGQTDQRKMPLVEGTHRGNERHLTSGAGFAVTLNVIPDLGNGLTGLHGEERFL